MALFLCIKKLENLMSDDEECRDEKHVCQDSFLKRNILPHNATLL